MVVQGRPEAALDDTTARSVQGGPDLRLEDPPLRQRWLLPTVVVASTVAWLAGATSGLADGRLWVALVASGAAFTAIAAGVPLQQQARTARARTDAVVAATRARAAMRVAIEDALDPFSALLVQLAGAPPSQQARLRGEAVQLALTAVGQITGLGRPGAATRRLRVCFFVLEPGPPARLVPQSYAGRSGTPTVTFDDSTRAGQYLLKVAATDWVVVHDTETMRPAVWWDDERRYRTFAAGPVPGADDVPLGLLTVDGLSAGDLDALDLPLMRLTGRLLALALRL